MTPRLLTLLPALALLAAACATYSVEGDFAGRTLDGHADPERTIVLIHNHGFSLARAGTYRPVTPPILRLAGDRNPDVVVFSQVRNLANPTAADHAAFIASAVAYFHAERGVPIENMILAGQSCGGWGSLYAAAFTYPTIGGVLAFAPTCHGKLPHPPEVRARRAWGLVRLAERLRVDGVDRGQHLELHVRVVALVSAHEHGGDLGAARAQQGDLERGRVEPVPHGVLAARRGDRVPLEPAERIEQVLHVRALRGARPTLDHPPVGLAAPLHHDRLAARSHAHGLDVARLERREHRPVTQLGDRAREPVERVGADDDDGPAAGDGGVRHGLAPAPVGRRRQQHRRGGGGARLRDRHAHGRPSEVPWDA